MKNRKIIFASVSIAMLLAIIGTSAATPVRTPGVNNGDSATYGNVSYSYYSNPSSPPPPEWEALGKTDRFVGTVQNIAGTNVTVSSDLHYSNGTDEPQSGWVDIDTGDNVNLGFLLISANLNAGDPIYSGSTYSTYVINETVSRTYSSGARQTNHLNETMSFSYPGIASVYLSMNFYWDRTTGILTELSIVSNQTMSYPTLNETDLSISFELTQTNRWTVPEFGGLPQILLLLSSITVVAVAQRRLRRTRKP